MDYNLKLLISTCSIKYCQYNANEGYERAATAMNVIEDELGLAKHTYAKPEHRYPYLSLNVFGVVCCLIAT